MFLLLRDSWLEVLSFAQCLGGVQLESRGKTLHQRRPGTRITNEAANV
jgi:hypothetical protein